METVLAPVSNRAFRWRTPLVLGITLLPGVLLAWLLSHPSQNPTLAAPTQHFIVVTTVSLIALAVAGIVTVAALQIQQYRVLFLALGFMSMGGIFAVHAAATPGFILNNAAPANGGGAPNNQAYGSYNRAGYSTVAPAQPATGNASAADPDGMPGMDMGNYSSTGGAQMSHAGTIVGLSAFLSLLVPALFFGIAYSRAGRPFNWLIRLRPMALVVVVAAGLVVYATLAFARPALFAGNPISLDPGSAIVAYISIALFLICAALQYKRYRATRVPLQGALIVAFLLLAEAQVSMLRSAVWTLAWWEYHVLMLGAVTISLGTLLYEYSQGRPVRRIIEGALELQVKVGIEIEHVEALALLAAATEAKSPDLKGHTIRVAELAVLIGREMNLPYETLRILAHAGLLHDIGKLGIPDAVLLKPGPLNDAEWVVMREHPQLGLNILDRLGRLRREGEILLAHHERVDGSGYPRGLAGEAIPLEARIIAVADTFDSLVSDRPYRRGMPREQALLIIREESGSHLDPPPVDAFLRILGKGEPSESVDSIYPEPEPQEARIASAPVSIG